MGGQRDSAIVRIVADQVSGNDVVVGCTGVVGNQDSAGVVLNHVVRDHGMIDAGQMDSFAAVVGFVLRKDGCNAGASAGSNIQSFIVV